MKETPDIINPSQIIELVLRHRWFVIIPVCLSLICGIYLAITLPKIYSASTLILVQPQKVPDDYVRSIVTTDIDSRINTISQQIMSRSNLEKIINDFSIFSKEEHAGMYMEDKIEIMRERVSVEVIREDRRRPADAFSISFKGKEPNMVMRVTNALATYFINENLKSREAQVLGTSDFLDDELQDIRKKLEIQEEELKNYRARYMGGLPEQLQTNLRILEGLQLQLNMKNESLRYAKNNMILLARQLEDASQTQETVTGAPVETEQRIMSEDEIKSQQIKDKLTELELSYTDRHPDIIKLRKQLNELELKIEATPEIQENSVPPPLRTMGMERRQLRVVDEREQKLLEWEELKFQIVTLESEIKKVEKQSRHFEKMVEDTPKREQELLSLNRDYENIKESYDSLLGRKLESDIAVNMEKKQKGEQFRIIDPARVPEKPSEPDMKKLFILVLGAGLGIGAGLIFLLQYFDHSFRKPEEVEAMLELPVLCTIPKLNHPRDLRLKRINQVLSICSVIIIFVLLAGFYLITLKNLDKMTELIRWVGNI